MHEASRRSQTNLRSVHLLLSLCCLSVPPPAAINTPFLDSVLNTPEKLKAVMERIPAGRLGVSQASTARGAGGAALQPAQPAAALLLATQERCCPTDPLLLAPSIQQDIVGPAVFLASAASDYVTGAEIVIDGGGTR